MAGAVRQPIDVASLERYIDAKVPNIQTPLQLKQVGGDISILAFEVTDLRRKVWIRPVQSHVRVG